MATNLKSQTYFILTVALFGFIILVASVSFTSAQTTIPEIQTRFTETFESGSWDTLWRPRPTDAHPGLEVLDGHGGKMLVTTVTTAVTRLRLPNVINAQEGYVSFWFNPNNVVIPEQNSSGASLTYLPDKSIVIAEVVGLTVDKQEKSLVALHLRKAADTGYNVFLRWNNVTGAAEYDQIGAKFNEVEIINGWQKITLGYRVGEWVGLWINDVSVRSITQPTVGHAAESGSFVHIGKPWANTAAQTVPSGVIQYDDITVAIPLNTPTPTHTPTFTPTPTETPTPKPTRTPTNTPTTSPLATTTPIPLLIPITQTILNEDFQNGSWGTNWRLRPSNVTNLSVVNQSRGMVLQSNISANIGMLRQIDIAKAPEGYLTFWFNPNNIMIPEQDIRYAPDKSITIAEILGPSLAGGTDERVVAALGLYKPIDGDYQIFLRWTTDSGGTAQLIYDQNAGGVVNTVGLTNGWQKVTLGYKIDNWVAVWLNEEATPRRSVVARHVSVYGSILHVGQVDVSSQIIPAGAILFDDLSFALPQVSDLWVDVNNSGIVHDGLTKNTAFLSISEASNAAVAGTVIHILPGIYRETIAPAKDGEVGLPIVYRAENGPGTVKLFGSKNSHDLTWTQLSQNNIGLPAGVNPSNIYYTQLAITPSLIVQSDLNRRLPIAREPDSRLADAWKYTEYWWTADGGAQVSSCDPGNDNNPNECDAASRSKTQLTDRNIYAEKLGVEAGSLTTLGDLTGAGIFVTDTNSGHYMYYRVIDAHEVTAGKITLVTPGDGETTCTFPGQTPDDGLGWGSKYFVEGLPQLLDNAGEWWYDGKTQRLYMWPPTAVNPKNLSLEISQETDGVDLSGRSFITLDGLEIQYYNGATVNIQNFRGPNGFSEPGDTLTLQNMTMRYANRGIVANQQVDSSADNVIKNFTLIDSEIGYMDRAAFTFNYTWGANDSNNPTEFTHAGIMDTVMKHNEFHHLAFRNNARSGDTAHGAVFNYPDKVRFEDNHLHDIAHNGVYFAQSVIQPTDSSRQADFSASEIKTGDILVKGNLVEDACQMGPDCGSIKFWGSGREQRSQVFRDVLVMNNTMRNNFGWSYVSGLRGKWSEGQVQGMGGFGLYVDLASGIHAYRNIAYNNPFSGYQMNGLWQDGVMIYYNNIAANSLYGFRLDATQFDDRGSVDTELVNNLLVNNERYGSYILKVVDNQFGNLTVNHNLYYNNYWNKSDFSDKFAGALGLFIRDPQNKFYNYPTTAEAKATSPWEANGLDGDPKFKLYVVSDHEAHDGSTPDFHLTADSTLTFGTGKNELPASLQTLLTHFNVTDKYSRTLGPLDFTGAGSTLSVYLPVLMKQ